MLPHKQTLCNSVTKTSLLMLFRKKVAERCTAHTVRLLWCRPTLPFLSTALNRRFSTLPRVVVSVTLRNSCVTNRLVKMKGSGQEQYCRNNICL
jgi:hypothetical protein